MALRTKHQQKELFGYPIFPFHAAAFGLCLRTRYVFLVLVSMTLQTWSEPYGVEGGDVVV